jgi:hypothetical protein
MRPAVTRLRQYLPERLCDGVDVHHAVDGAFLLGMRKCMVEAVAVYRAMHDGRATAVLWPLNRFTHGDSVMGMKASAGASLLIEPAVATK